MEEYMASELSGIFISKTDCQKYSAWVPRDPTPICLYSVMSHS